MSFKTSGANGIHVRKSHSKLYSNVGMPVLREKEIGTCHVHHLHFPGTVTAAVENADHRFVEWKDTLHDSCVKDYINHTTYFNLSSSLFSQNKSKW